MTRRFLFAIALSLLLPASAGAQDFSGYLELKGFAFTEASPTGDSRFAGWGTFFDKYEDKVGDSLLCVSVRAEGITARERGPLAFDPADRDLRRTPFSVRDLWLRVPLAPALDLQAGRFQLGWGKTDGYSPADAFLPRDLSDPFADEKLPLWGVRLNGERGPFRFDAIAVPVTTPWRLPVLGGRNAPLPAAGLPEGTSFHEEGTGPPVPGFAALRLLATFGEWDVGAWGRFGVRPAPLLTFRFDRAVVLPSGIEIPVERRYAHEEAAGIELSRLVGSWVLRAEGAALFSRDPGLGDALIGAASAERGFGDGTVLVTIAGNARQTPVDPSLLFDRALLPVLIFAWNRSEEWGSWKIVASTGFRYGDGMVKGEVGYNITDIWKVTFGAELPYGSERGPIGALSEARRVQAALRRSW